MAMNKITTRITHDAYQLELMVYLCMLLKAREDGVPFPRPPLPFEDWVEILMHEEDVAGFNNWVTFVSQVFGIKSSPNVEQQDVDRAFNLLSSIFNQVSPDSRVQSSVFLDTIKSALARHVRVHFAFRDTNTKGAAPYSGIDSRHIAWEGYQAAGHKQFALDVTMSSASAEHVSKSMHAFSGDLEQVAKANNMVISVPDMIEGDPTTCLMERVDSGVPHHYVRFRLQPNEVVNSGE